MLPLFFSDGQCIESIPISNRAIHYGDGAFETIAIANNKPQFIEEHLNRLQKASEALKIPVVPHTNILFQLAQILNKYPQEKAILKILLTRGEGGRGYHFSAEIIPRLIFALYPWPIEIDHYAQEGIDVFYCNTKLAHNNNLVGIKHLNRLEQVMAASEFDLTLYQEGFMFDIEDNLIEGTKSNIFIVHNNVLKTPMITHCGIAGIMRDKILNIAKNLKIDVIETIIDKKMLEKATEIFVCNSVIKVWPVKSIMNRVYSIGKITKKIKLSIKETL